MVWGGVKNVKNVLIIRVFFKRRKNPCHYVKKVIFKTSAYL